MQTVYAYSGRDVGKSQLTLAAMVRSESLEGDVEIDESYDEVRTCVIRKGICEPITVMRSLSARDISFRRSWHHIRAKKAATRLVYFISQGELRVVNSAGSYAVSPGQFTIINTDEPFFSRAVVGTRGSFECSLAVVPEHLMMSCMPWARDCNMALNVDDEHRQLTTRLLDLLCTHGANLSRKSAQSLATAFLQAVSDSVVEQVQNLACPPSTMDKRFAEIKAYIQKYSMSPDLNCDSVAMHCGVSTRYVCQVLSINHTSFSELLWNSRLPSAKNMLLSQSFRDYPVHKIASMAGFKSPAHFSRMFKANYGIPPTEYRAQYKELGHA